VTTRDKGLDLPDYIWCTASEMAVMYHSQKRSIFLSHCSHIENAANFKTTFKSQHEKSQKELKYDDPQQRNMVKIKRHNDIVRYVTWNVRSIHEKEEELD
ncbi:hypothetical protein L9F63_011968, partial [Diploptera punctata]